MKRTFRYFIDGVEVDSQHYEEAYENDNFIGELSIKIEKEETIESLKETIEKLQLEIENLKKNQNNNWWEKYIEKRPYEFPNQPFSPLITYYVSEPIDVSKVNCTYSS